MGNETEDGQGKGVKPRINRRRRQTENEIKKKEEEKDERIWGVEGSQYQFHSISHNFRSTK